MHLVEECVQALLIAMVASQPHARFGLGTVVVHHAFAHVQCLALDKVAHCVFHVLEACCTGEFGNLHPSALCGEVKHHLLAVAQATRCLFLIVRVYADISLALYLQSAGHCGLVDFTHRAQVVVGEPLPETQLRMAQDGTFIEYAQHLFHLVSLRRAVVKHHHNGGVDFLAPKWYQHTAAHLRG